MLLGIGRWRRPDDVGLTWTEGPRLRRGR